MSSVQPADQPPLRKREHQVQQHPPANPVSHPAGAESQRFVARQRQSHHQPDHAARHQHSVPKRPNGTLRRAYMPAATGTPTATTRARDSTRTALSDMSDTGASTNVTTTSTATATPITRSRPVPAEPPGTTGRATTDMAPPRPPRADRRPAAWRALDPPRQRLPEPAKMPHKRQYCIPGSANDHESCSHAPQADAAHTQHVL